MASQGQTKGTQNQAFRTQTDMPICTSCGIEWFSVQNLQRKLHILESQQGILQDQLYRAGHAHQLNELNMRTLNHDRQRWSGIAESSKQTVANLQRHLDSQRAAFEAERVEHALVVQSLKQESARRETAEKSVEHERATVQKLATILDRLELSNAGELDIDLPDNVGLATLVQEWGNMNSEVKSLRNELKVKAGELQREDHNLESLAGEFEERPQSVSETCFSDSDEDSAVETAKLQIMSPAEGKITQVE